jgi:hypothetical protein
MGIEAKARRLGRRHSGFDALTALPAAFEAQRAARFQVSPGLVSERSSAQMSLWHVAAGIAVGLAAGCPPEQQCDSFVPLVAMDRFSLVAPEDDPFSPPADAPLCQSDEIRAEPFGNGPVALDVDTSDRCGWATLTQGTSVTIGEDDDIFFKIFYFSQQTFPAAQAQLAIALGDDVLWSTLVEIPTASDVVEERVKPPRATAADTPFLFHLGNHGANSWSLLEVQRVQRVPCSQVDGGAD